MVRPTGWLKVLLTAILLVMVAIAGLGIYLHDKPRFEVFAGLTGTNFIAGQDILYEPYMIYRGWLPITLTSANTLFIIQVCDEEGRDMLAPYISEDGKYMVPYAISEVMRFHKLWPFLPYKAPLERNPPLDPRTPPPSFTLNKPGRYKVVVHASFAIGKRGEEIKMQGEKKQRIYSEPVWIEVVEGP